MSLADPATARGAGPLVRWLLTGHVCGAIGVGLTGPYLFVYLWHGRGLGVGTSCLLLAWAGLAWCLAQQQGRRLAGRRGPRPLVLTALGAQACGLLCLLGAGTRGPALVALTLLGVGAGLVVAPLDALFAQVVPVAGRPRVSALRALSARGGRCAGALLSVLLLGLAGVTGFQRVFLLAAVAHLGFLLILMRMPGIGRVALRGPGADWERAALDGSARGLLLDAVAFGQRLTGFPAYASTVVQVGPAVLGFACAAYEAVGLAVEIRTRPGSGMARPAAGPRDTYAGAALLARAPVVLDRARVGGWVAAMAAACWLLLGLAGVVAGTAAAPLVVTALMALGVAAAIRRRAALDAAELTQRQVTAATARWPRRLPAMVGAALLAAGLFGAGWPRLWLAVVGLGTLVAAAGSGRRGGSATVGPDTA